jgi:hypothetical protein
MIIYDLACRGGHRFEGWFRSAGDFDAQLSKGLLTCAICGSDEVRKLPSAPYVHASSSDAPPPPIAAPERAAAVAEVAPAVLRKLVEAIVRETEDVGPRFAEEARRMHAGDSPERGIRGQATSREVRELADEGIDVVPIPRHWFEPPH